MSDITCCVCYAIGGGALVDVGFGYATANGGVFRAGFGQFSV